MFIIDFDNTIFNTHTDPGNFVEMRAKALQEIGVSEELYLETSRQINIAIKNGIGVYTDERHAEAIAQYGFDKQVILGVLKKNMGQNLVNFLFPDAIDFLQTLRKTGQLMILFSFGNEEFQYEKVRGCDIEKYFDRVFFTDRPKQEVLHELLGHIHQQEVWFINDRVEETQKVVSAFPEIKAVLKISCNNSLADYQNSGLPYFKTLTEIKKYILGK